VLLRLRTRDARPTPCRESVGTAQRLCNHSATFRMKFDASARNAANARLALSNCFANAYVMKSM
jgi:hypothetical protein